MTESEQRKLRRLSRRAAREELAWLKKKYEAGDVHCLMQAIRVCANWDLVMPDWVARGYIRRFDKVNLYRAASWDDVFGKPLKKGQHLRAQRKRLVLGFAAWQEVNKLVVKGYCLEEAFREAARLLLTNTTTVKQMYYAAKRSMRPRSD